MGAMASQITSLTIVYSTVYSGADQRKRKSSASLAFVRGIHRWPVNSPHKGPVARKMFPFGDVIMLTMIQLVVLCLTAPSHYLIQCWSSFTLPYSFTMAQWVKSLKAGDATMRWLKAHVMVWCLRGTMPLPEPILGCCKLDYMYQDHTSVKCALIFHSKNTFQNVGCKISAINFSGINVLNWTVTLSCTWNPYVLNQTVYLLPYTLTLYQRCV